MLESEFKGFVYLGTNSNAMESVKICRFKTSLVGILHGEPCFRLDICVENVASRTVVLDKITHI